MPSDGGTEREKKKGRAADSSTRKGAVATLCKKTLGGPGVEEGKGERWKER